jgi:hypothetical protein
MDFRLAMEGGREELLSADAAEGTAASAAAVAPVWRKWRRENRVMGIEFIRGGWPAARTEGFFPKWERMFGWLVVRRPGLGGSSPNCILYTYKIQQKLIMYPFVISNLARKSSQAIDK